MTSRRQGVISGSIDWNGKEYVEIFDRDYKYLYGEVDDLFIAYGSWVEYDVVDAPQNHPKNCLKRAINIDMDMKTSNAPTTDEFGDKPMNVRDFNKVDYFQFNLQGDGSLTHKSTIRRNYTNDMYYNPYYGEVTLSRDCRNRLIQFDINEVDVMMNFISSEKYCGAGPHWEVTHFIHQGKMYSINGFLSIRGFVLRGPGGVVRNRRDVIIPPDALRPMDNTYKAKNKESAKRDEWEQPSQPREPVNTGFGMRSSQGFGGNSPQRSLEQGIKSLSINSPNQAQGSTRSTGDSRGLGSFGAGSFGETAKPTSRSFGGPRQQEMTPTPDNNEENRSRPLASGLPKSFGGTQPRNPPLSSQVRDTPRQKEKESGWNQLPPEKARNTERSIQRGGSNFNSESKMMESKPLPLGFGGASKGFQNNRDDEFWGRESPPHPLDDDFDSFIDKPKKTEGKVSSLYDDDWGESLPQAIKPTGLPRSGYPSRSGTGLSKYGQSHF